MRIRTGGDKTSFAKGIHLIFSNASGSGNYTFRRHLALPRGKGGRCAVAVPCTSIDRAHKGKVITFVSRGKGIITGRTFTDVFNGRGHNVNIKILSSRCSTLN